MWQYLKNLWKKPPPKVGLALGGGGARGLAHIGVLKVLEQEGVKIDCLAGTSMGGLIAAGYAAGLNPSSLEEEALRMTSLRRLLALADPSLPRRGLFEGQKVREYLASYLGNRTFDDLQIPLTLVAVDLNTGREVHLAQGRVVDGVRATIALPGVFTPVKWDEQLLVDGGLLDNLPADATRRMGADVVIAVDVASDAQMVSHMTQALHRHRYIPNVLVDTIEVLWRSLGVMMEEIGRRRLAEAHPEVIIRPAIPPDVTVLTGFSRAADIIAAGEEAAREALPNIQALLPTTEP
ncbi:MAG: patatin-like phospholipase family protein [Chloroflexota bacterium]|nr:patatin-like phospholipase family protein [Chloroflexota bacterium]